MRNPLNKRFFREIKNNFARHFVLFLLLIVTIGEVSGFLVSDHSLITAYEDSFSNDNIEDGNFTSADKLTEDQVRSVEENRVKLYEDHYSDRKLDNESTLRIYKNREEVNKVNLLSGKMPKAEDEIAVDRLYAKNNDLKVGDAIRSGENTWKITGMVALSDYSALFSKNSDTIFDSTKFGVSIVNADGWDKIKDGKVEYRYSWKYDNQPESKNREKEVADELLKSVSVRIILTDFTPRYANQAITYTGEDFGSDRAMMQVLLYIVIVIIAFIFAVTMANTIERESCVIGTLLATGYRKKDLLFHYMRIPTILTIIGGVAGNILGYTFMKDLNAAAYYNSYSLPNYKTVWNPDAFIQTTLIPIAIVFVINILILNHRLNNSPLNFLRGNLSKKDNMKVIPLSHRRSIIGRFRTRVFFGNLPSYMVIIIGVIFSNTLLLFGFMLPSTLKHYQETMPDQMFAAYQYILKRPAETGTDGAEAFSVYALKTIEKDGYISEDINLYGLKNDSKYVKLDDKNKTYISSAFAAKYDLKAGDTYTLKEKYSDKTYDIRIDGIHAYTGGISVFMSQERLNRMFDLGDNYYNAYFSNKKITDIDEKITAALIDVDVVTQVSRQLEKSMGGVMNIIKGFSVLIFIIIIYILSKLIIERSARSISISKILGYKNSDIGKIYIATTSIIVVASIIGTILIANVLVSVIYRALLMKTLKGWLPLFIGPGVYAQMIIIGIVAYIFIAILEFRRISKIPLNIALKDAL
ncbi:MAG: ABC transporter permease [Clostridiales bacterium]|nr:ABC transporter permease [Clostridiales bacterium]MBS5878135.1 ABC transporter permease [Clostridiales bacterium]